MSARRYSAGLLHRIHCPTLVVVDIAQRLMRGGELHRYAQAAE
jgi:hypothetical protein